MKENNFVFADLSTYDLRTAQSFYSSVFDWSFYDSGGQYYVSSYQERELCGLYETPDKFKEMNMPSFWMSYIQVNSVEQTVKQAKNLGGIVELVDLQNSIGAIALIRDPMGAGFTIYEGDQLNARFDNEENALVWNELFVSDFYEVKSFYEGIFNWTIGPAKDGCRLIYNSKKEEIAAIQEVSNEIKGKYEYWGVFFAVKDVEQIRNKVISNGGSLIYEDDYFTALADPFGAFFI